jgi:hypothetical protein
MVLICISIILVNLKILDKYPALVLHYSEGAAAAAGCDFVNPKCRGGEAARAARARARRAQKKFTSPPVIFVNVMVLVSPSKN